MKHKRTHFSARRQTQDEAFPALSPEKALGWKRGLLMRETPQRQTWKVYFPDDSRPFFLKKYFPSRKWRGDGWAQCSKELAALQKLSKLGLPVPKVVHSGRKERVGSFLLMEACEGEPLDRLLTQAYPDPSDAGSYMAKCLWLRAIADLVSRFHRAGYSHRDLYLCHLLGSWDSGGKIKLYLIDLQRAEKRWLRRWYVKDLAALDFSSPPSISRADRLRFLLLWLGKKRVDASVRRWVRSVRAKRRRIASHRPKYG